MAKKSPKRAPAVIDRHLDKMTGDATGRPDRRISRAKDGPPPPEKPPIPAGKRWLTRLLRATKSYDAWSGEFECDHLDQYYEGKQWRGTAENDAKKKYVINMVFATVETQKPSLLFTKPKVKCEARPSHVQTAGSEAGARATLIEQTVQTDIDDPKVRFRFETDLALADAYSRFGLVEVGYSGDWIDNPNADKPMLNDDKSPMLDGDDKEVLHPKKLPKPGMTESVFIRRIDPATARCSPGRNALQSNDWFSYYTWEQLEDVKANPNYRNTADLQASGTLATTADAETQTDTDTEAAAKVGMVKLWRIWDLRQKERHVYAEGHDELLQTKAYTVFPVFALKFFERRNSFYPVPPIYNWLSPQDEINETREMQKVHRRRALRRYMAEPQVAPEELEKLETGEDMVCITVPKATPPPIVPIQDAPLDMQNWTELAAANDDLNKIAGVSGEMRNSPQAPTATQANIMNVRASIREARARQQVADWLAEIARGLLLVRRDRVKLPFMVKRTVDPFAQPVSDSGVNAQTTASLWRQVQTEDIDALDVDVTIDVASLSPVAEDAQRTAWTMVLTLLTNPPLAILLFTPVPEAPTDPSPLLRKTLVLHGITSDQEIREIWRVGQAILAQAAAAAQATASQAKAPEPMKISLALKADDFANPTIGPLLLAILQREENMQAQAAAGAQPENPLFSGNAGAQPMTPPSAGTTGTPTPAPSGM